MESTIMRSYLTWPWSSDITIVPPVCQRAGSAVLQCDAAHHLASSFSPLFHSHPRPIGTVCSGSAVSTDGGGWRNLPYMYIHGGGPEKVGRDNYLDHVPTDYSIRPTQFRSSCWVSKRSTTRNSISWNSWPTSSGSGQHTSGIMYLFLCCILCLIASHPLQSFVGLQ